jgi:hypothetical protein
MADRQDWRPALDASARGFISYWPDGHMQVVIGAGERPRLRGEWSGISPEQKAECLDKLVAYAGNYSVEGEVVTHHVDVCWIPNWEGRELKRAMSFPAPGRLLLATLPDDGPRARPAQRVLWERVE